MIKPQYINQSFGYPTHIMDLDTAEVKEFTMPKGAKVKMQVPTENVVYTIKNFVHFDPRMEELLYTSDLSASDYRRLHLMACWVETEFNMVSTPNHRPYTLETLSKALIMKEDEARKMINRLVDFGLVVWSVCVESGHSKKIFMLSPHYIRKRTTFHKCLLDLFPDLATMEKRVIATKKKASKNQAVATA